MSDPAVVVRARRLRAARGMVVARDVALTPLLRLSTHPATVQTPGAGAAAWLYLPGLALAAIAAFLAARLT